MNRKEINKLHMGADSVENLSFLNQSGVSDTDKLKRNLEIQLDRLFEQLTDLENYRKDMSEQEYFEAKMDTMDQLKEFSESLEKIVKGNVTLVSALARVRLSTQLAISNAFKTPDIVRMFSKNHPDILRNMLKENEDCVHKQKVDVEYYERRKAEILTALRQLGEQLSVEELIFLEKHNDIANVFKNIELVKVSETET